MIEVSLVIPTYNQQSRLRATLTAINHQNYDRERFEVIVVDDGSTDETAHVLQQLSTNYRLHGVQQDHAGRAAARNTGVRSATGELIVFSDSDRLLDPNCIQEHVSSHRQRPNHVTIGNIMELFISDFDERVETYLERIREWDPAIFRSARHFNYAECVLQMYEATGTTRSSVPWISLFSGNFSVSKQIFEDIGGFDPRFRKWGLENLEMGYRLHQKGYGYQWNAAALNFHIFHGSNRDGQERDENFLLFQEKYPHDDVKKVLEFLDGNISLQQLDALAQNHDPLFLRDQDPIFYNKHRFGSRFIYHTHQEARENQVRLKP